MTNLPHRNRFSTELRRSSWTNTACHSSASVISSTLGYRSSTHGLAMEPRTYLIFRHVPASANTSSGRLSFAATARRSSGGRARSPTAPKGGPWVGLNDSIGSRRRAKNRHNFRVTTATTANGIVTTFDIRSCLFLLPRVKNRKCRRGMAPLRRQSAIHDVNEARDVLFLTTTSSIVSEPRACLAP